MSDSETFVRCRVFTQVELVTVFFSIGFENQYAVLLCIKEKWPETVSRNEWGTRMDFGSAKRMRPRADGVPDTCFSAVETSFASLYNTKGDD